MTTKQAGLTLIEVLIASIVFTVGVLGLISAITSATIVDTVAQEHNLALEAAREVIERVKSEGAATLLNRITESHSYAAADANTDANTDPTGGEAASTTEAAYSSSKGVTEPVADTQATTLNTNQTEGQTSSKAQNEGSAQAQGKGQGKGSSSSAGEPTDEDAVGAFSAAPGVESSDAPSTSLAAVPLSWFGTPLGEGSGIVEVDSDGNFAVPGLDPCADDPDGRVGKVVVTQFAPDVVEITVTVRWRGSRGPGQQVLRCRITDWQGQDGI